MCCAARGHGLDVSTVCGSLPAAVWGTVSLSVNQRDWQTLSPGLCPAELSAGLWMRRVWFFCWCFHSTLRHCQVPQTIDEQLKGLSLQLTLLLQSTTLASIVFLDFVCHLGIKKNNSEGSYFILILYSNSQCNGQWSTRPGTGGRVETSTSWATFYRRARNWARPWRACHAVSGFSTADK